MSGSGSVLDAVKVEHRIKVQFNVYNSAVDGCGTDRCTFYPLKQVVTTDLNEAK